MIILFFLSGIFFIILSILGFIFSVYLILLKVKIFLSWNLIEFISVNMIFFIYIDWISLMFIFTVLLISSMIMFYCSEYMSHDNYSERFFYLVFIFIISMILMIVSPNLISLILGWDGLGLSSYLLVIFYQNIYSYNSGMLTVLMNRVGDVLLLMSISMMFIFGSWNFMFLNNYNFILFILVVLASFTKSAQFPFSSWLPAAMAAPTPVSSLVHSSTLVTAGMYLLIRFKSLIYLSNLICLMILSVGMITMFMASVSANFEMDFKKIIAFSTLSQLGLMMVIYGMKFWYLSFFHLVIHAMFKSMMFMCSGIIIHFSKNCQDIRFFGNLFMFMPFTMVMFMISNLALCGMPFFSGFYSKDLILEKIFMSEFSLFLFFFLILSTMLTVMYSFRLFYFLTYKNLNFFSFYNLSDMILMNFSLLILMINTVIFGNFMFWILFINIEEIYLMVFEKVMILFFLIFSIFLSKNFFLNFKYLWLGFFIGKMFYLNYLNFFYSLLLIKMKNYYNLIDKGFSTYLFENFIKDLMKLISLKLFNNNNLIKLMFFFSYLILLNLII
uniref:NADH:ubiquinone reductase (H(+)-translocating) n=1 Tax=Diaphorencyrtus aligarhensis TaxID=436678 RepID=A0A6C0M690_9HYME|nr:NADH dehydrogenase subunit 5 [Diaphorencyrtus aligarhensis]QHU77261.1 NADH dehydrogenase subunit 5 [Diaphorencyrtus aligarhensis]